METIYAVRGMTCEHCENRVASELRALPEIASAVADFHSGTVTLHENSPLDTDRIREAIEEAGYELVEPAATS